MKVKYQCSFVVTLLISILCSIQLYAKSWKVGNWSLYFNEATKTVDVYKDTLLLCNAFYPEYKYKNNLVRSFDYLICNFNVSELKDAVGHGKCLQIVYRKKNLPELVQSFYIYPEKEYFLTDIRINDTCLVSTNYMAPINIDLLSVPLTWGKNPKALFIPYDNDKWIRSRSVTLSDKCFTSYEVSAVFDSISRQGLIVGSVEHDVWKSAVVLDGFAEKVAGRLRCFGGVADELTRDVKAHGALVGHSLKSPKIFIGYFKDWRKGMEKYAKANVCFFPSRKWDKGAPHGWNSWGALKFDLTYRKALEVSDYLKNELYGFTNQSNALYIGLDSGWNSFTEQELHSFVEHCKRNGQKAGIYWTPFADWGKNPEKFFEDCPSFRYKDIYLYANGKPQELDGAFALDPTHPAVEASIKAKADFFRQLGFEYIKLDFMTHGALEADKWYVNTIRTGMEGYNYGMRLLRKYFAGFYLNLSISPVFPFQYAHSRRVACDAWSSIKDTEYTLNALAYGWWQGMMYCYNDADHIVLDKATEGENRARITSGIITGLYILGDDFSLKGNHVVKCRAIDLLTRENINSVATGTAFKPVEVGDGPVNKFVRQEADGSCYLAVFNYSENTITENLCLERIGLQTEHDYLMEDLWQNRKAHCRTKVRLVIPAKDVTLIKFYR